MKKMIFWAALFWACALVGQEPSVIFFDSVGHYEPPVLLGLSDLSQLDSGLVFYSMPPREVEEYECKQVRREVPWWLVREGNGGCADRCAGAFTSPEYCHEWVNAEDGDINPPKSYTLAVYYPCGNPWEVYFARICERCGREERRAVFYSYEQVAKPLSQFRELQKKFHGSGN